MISDNHDSITNESPAALPTREHGTDRRSRLRRVLRELLFIVGVIALYLVLSIFVLPRFGFQT